MPFFHATSGFADLPQGDRDALRRLALAPSHDIKPRRDLAREGDNLHQVRILIEGWACRYKTTREGHRQIIGFILPGEFCDLGGHLFGKMDHSISSITPLKIVQVSTYEINTTVERHPKIGQAFWWNELRNCSIQREWLLNLGQRSAYERVGHLLLELFHRLGMVRTITREDLVFPLTQTDIAEATGLTAVHVNRIIREFRMQGLVELERKILRIPNLPQFMAATDFSPQYLQIEQKGLSVDTYA